MTRLRTVAACHTEANRPYVEQPFRPVPLPVDVSDAEAFPEINRAIAHARKMREAGHG